MKYIPSIFFFIIIIVCLQSNGIQILNMGYAHPSKLVGQIDVRPDASNTPCNYSSCGPCDNLVCDGDFENVGLPHGAPLNQISIQNQVSGTPVMPWTNGGTGGASTTDLFPNWIAGFGCPYYDVWCDPTTTSTSPPAPCPYNVANCPPCGNGGTIAGQYMSVGCYENNLEALAFDLCRPLEPNCDYEISFWVYTGCGITVDFVFSDEPPCTNTPIQTYQYNGALPYTNAGLGGSTLCSGGQIYTPLYDEQFVFSSPTMNASGNFGWEQRTRTFQVTTTGIQHLVVHGEPIGNPIGSFLIDDIEVKRRVCTPIQLNASASPEMVCPEDQVVLSYDLCVPDPSALPVTGFNVTVNTQGIIVANPGPLLSTGPNSWSVTLYPANFDPTTGCLSTPIQITGTAAFTTGTFTFPIRVTNGCIGGIVGTQPSIVIMPPALTVSASTTSPALGQLVTFSFMVCNNTNQPSQPLTVLPLNLPSSFNYQPSPFFPNGPNNASIPFMLLPGECETLTLVGRFIGGTSFCPELVDVCAAVDFIPNNCSPNQECVSINLEPNKLTVSTTNPPPFRYSDPQVQAFFTQTTNNQILVTEDLIIDGMSPTWSFLDVTFAPGRSLILDVDPNTGQHSELHLHNTTLRACDHMWNGVKIIGATGANKLVMQSNSGIADAVIGIHSSDGGLFEIENSTLDNNWEHLVVEQMPAGSISTVSGTLFNCTGLIAPFSGQFTQNAIRIEDSDLVTIGTQNVINGRNTILNARTGVLGQESGIEIFRTDFNITASIGGVFSPLIGVNVVTRPYQILSFPSPPPPLRSLRVDDCSFNNLRRGIMAKGYFASTIENSLFNDCSGTVVRVLSGSQYGANPIKINSNTATGAFNYGIMVEPGQFSDLSINYNNINLNEPITHLYGIYVSTATSLWPVFSTPTKAIAYNTINEVVQGITTNNLYNLHIHHNSVTTETVTNSVIKTAITAHNSYGLDVHFNDVTNQQIGAPKLSRGFSFSSNRNTFISCNTPIATGTSMAFTGNNALNSRQGLQKGSANIVKNDMINTFEGLVIQQGGIIGDQGQSSPFTTNDNAWLGTIIGNEVANNGNSNAHFYIDNSDPIYEPDRFFPLPAAYTTGVPYLQRECPDPGTLPLMPVSYSGDDSEWIAHLLDIVNGNGNSDELAHYLMKRDLYLYLRFDPVGQSIMDMEPALFAFKATMDEEPYGQLVEVTARAAEGNITEAQLLNSSIIPNHIYEEYEQTVNNYWLANEALGEVLLSDAAISDLTYIASQCWFDAGPATIRARDMLIWWYAIQDDAQAISYQFHSDDCTTGEDDLFGNLNSQPNRHNNEYFELYPNPANNQITLRFESENEAGLEFILMNAAGKIVLNKEVIMNSEKAIISVAHLPRGMYFGLLKQDREFVGMQRLVIN